MIDIPKMEPARAIDGSKIGKSSWLRTYATGKRSDLPNRWLI